MEPKIIELPQFFVIGVVVYGNSDSGLFPKAWDIYMKLQKKLTLKNPGVGYGVEFYTEEFLKEKKFYYMACGEVHDLKDIPANMVGKVIPANSYAVFTSKGGVNELSKTFQYVYHEWLPKAKYEIADPYDFELYDERFKGMDNPATEIDIHIPITEK
ncbi:MAG: AraC family transcriptional regulator [candidate division WOR-3 bacterium]|nr:MAG: AraC family transcriptional regulator [candidate division WOR-3 bacterium]